MAKCINCGGEKWVVTATVGSLETWRCEACEHEELVHVYAPQFEPPMTAALESVFNLFGSWRGKPTARDIAALQSLFPRIRAVSAAELMRKALAHERLELGRFAERELQPLASRLDSLEIALERLPIPR